MTHYDLDITAVTDEKWVDLIGYEGSYTISNYGRIKSLHKFCEGIRNQYCNRKGYLLITLSKNSKSQTALVHRLVLKSFIGIDPERNEVNHINCNKRDNRLSNLEWCTQHENVKHAKENKLYKGFCHTRKVYIPQSKLKAVLKCDKDFNVIEEFPSLKDAAAKHKIPAVNISSAIAGIKQKTAAGFRWKIKEAISTAATSYIPPILSIMIGDEESLTD